MAADLILMLGKCPKYKMTLSYRGYFRHLIVILKMIVSCFCIFWHILRFSSLKQENLHWSPLSPTADSFIGHGYPRSQVSNEYFGISSDVTLYNKAKVQKNQKNKQSEI